MLSIPFRIQALLWSQLNTEANWFLSIPFRIQDFFIYLFVMNFLIIFQFLLGFKIESEAMLKAR